MVGDKYPFRLGLKVHGGPASKFPYEMTICVGGERKEAAVTELVHKATVIPQNIGWIMNFPVDFSSSTLWQAPPECLLRKSHRFQKDPRNVDLEAAFVGQDPAFESERPIFSFVSILGQWETTHLIS